jgi:hypothetical protein
MTTCGVEVALDLVERCHSDVASGVGFDPNLGGCKGLVIGPDDHGSDSYRSVRSIRHPGVEDATKQKPLNLDALV